jgi:hypothetical protein
MKVKDILEEQFKDLISEETLNLIQTSFEEAVKEKVEKEIIAENENFNNKLTLEVENVKQQIDAEYTEKLQTVLEKVDKDHTEKLQALVEKIDEDHTAKLEKLIEAIDTDHAVKLQKLVKNIDVKHASMLKQVVEKYEATLNEEAKSFQERLVEEVSNYLDLYLDKTIPADQINEAVENIRAAKQIEEIRKIVGISEELVDSEIKEALVDGKKTIDSLRKELNEALKENVTINHEYKKAQAHILLESKTSDMPVSKKTFISRLLKNKDVEYINENFSYVVDMFERETQTEVEEAQENIISEQLETTIDRPQVIEEQANFNNEIEREATSDGVSGYLNEMKKISKTKFAR